MKRLKRTLFLVTAAALTAICLSCPAKDGGTVARYFISGSWNLPALHSEYLDVFDIPEAGRGRFADTRDEPLEVRVNVFHRRHVPGGASDASKFCSLRANMRSLAALRRSPLWNVGTVAVTSVGVPYDSWTIRRSQLVVVQLSCRGYSEQTGYIYFFDRDGVYVSRMMLYHTESSSDSAGIAVNAHLPQ